MEIGVKEGRAVTSRALASHPVNRGKLCPKGLSEHYTIGAENRAKYPLLRKNGKLERVSWQEALTTMVERFGKVQAKYGRESLGVLSTGQLVTEEFYTLGKLVQLGFGTSNYDGNTTLCMATAVSGYKLSFGSDGPPGNYEDMQIADVVLLIGANIADNHPILCQYLEANRNKTLIVADPRVTKTAMMANLHLPLKPRSDLALLNGIAHILIHYNLIDRDYIAAHTTGFDELEKFLEAYAPERVSALTGLSQDILFKTAFLYGRAKVRLHRLDHGREPQHHRHRDRQRHLQSRAAHRQDRARRLLRRSPSRASATRWGRAKPASLPACRVTGSSTILRTARNSPRCSTWMRAAFPPSAGWLIPDIVEATVAKKIRALWIIGTNPLVSYPNQGMLRHGLENLDFLVVQDAYHPTPTTELADLVLPAAMWGEKEGTYTNSERRVSKVNKAVEPPGEARSDFDIFLALAAELGCRDSLFPGWTGPEDAFNEWRRVSHGRLCDYSGISYEMLASRASADAVVVAALCGWQVQTRGWPRQDSSARTGRRSPNSPAANIRSC